MKKTTRIKTILKTPEAVAVMRKYLPDFGKDERLKMAGMMTVQQLIGYAPELMDETKKLALYADLAPIVEPE